jgi:hypothetical protein
MSQLARGPRRGIDSKANGASRRRDGLSFGTAGEEAAR